MTGARRRRSKRRFFSMKIGSEPSLRAALAALILTAVAMLGGCAAGGSPSFAGNANADVLGCRTYAVLPFSSASQSTSSLDPFSIEMLMESICDTMDGKGYKRTRVSEADVIVNVRAPGVPEVDVKSWGLSYAGVKEWAPNYDPNSANESANAKEMTLIIEAFQGSDSKLVWVGWTRCRMPVGAIYLWYLEAIEPILNNFPPAWNS